MTANGEELIFISRILRDGTGVETIEDQDLMMHVRETVFNLSSLSLTQKTYIASEFNSYVVRKKEDSL
jgi:hypothetical protein